MAEHHPDEESESARTERHRRAERRHWTFEKIGGSFALIFTAVAACGAIVSAFAAYWAYKETGRTAKAAIEANQIAIRPYIKVKLEPESFALNTVSNGVSDFRSVKFLIQNIGRLPGLVWVQSAINWDGRGHQGNELNWPSIGIVARVFLFPEEKGTEFGSEPLSITKGQITDMAMGGARLYVLVDALYGPSTNIELHGPSTDYETKVCSSYLLKGPAAGTGVLSLDSEATPCPSEGSNYAK